MTNWPILSVVTFLPLAGVILIYFARGDDEASVQRRILSVHRIEEANRTRHGQRPPGKRQGPVLAETPQAADIQPHGRRPHPRSHTITQKREALGNQSGRELSQCRFEWSDFQPKIAKVGAGRSRPDTCKTEHPLAIDPWNAGQPR